MLNLRHNEYKWTFCWYYIYIAAKVNLEDIPKHGAAVTPCLSQPSYLTPKILWPQKNYECPAKQSLDNTTPCTFHLSKCHRTSCTSSALVSMLAWMQSLWEPSPQILPDFASLISPYSDDRWDPTRVLPLGWAHLGQAGFSTLHFFPWQSLSITPWPFIV